MFKLVSLNLNGIRAARRKGLADWIALSVPDCICVQEMKLHASDLSDELAALAGLRGHFHLAQKKGYSGVGIYTRHEPSDVIVGYGSEEFDAEGRFIELRFDAAGRKRSIISVYFPSGTSGDLRQEAKYRFLAEIQPLLAQRRSERDFILCADVNIAHQPIDLKNWKSNQKNSGFLPEERAWLSDTLDRVGLVDVYRRLYPDATGEGYTWWSYRGRAWDNNVGWRIDYHLATPALAALARHAAVYKDVRFSDHAPLTVAYDLVL